MSRIGRGLAWVHRRFAKPFFSGSIPATASSPPRREPEPLYSVLERMFDAVGGPVAAREMLEAAAFNKLYRAPVPLIWLARAVIWKLREQRDEWKDAAISAKKELSILKRAYGGIENELKAMKLAAKRMGG